MRDLFDILKLTIEDFNVIDNRNVSLCYSILRRRSNAILAMRLTECEMFLPNRCMNDLSKALGIHEWRSKTSMNEVNLQ